MTKNNSSSRCFFFRWLGKLPGGLACRLINFALFLRGKRARFFYSDSGKVYTVNDGSTRQKKFFNPRRGFEIYSNGVAQRGWELGKSYGLHLIAFEGGDIVIDCGANYGDLVEFFPQRLCVEYFAFEPGCDELKTIRQNYPNANVSECGLSNRAEVKTLFVSEDTADSSLIEPRHYSRKAEIKTTTLDSFVAERAVERIKLFKVEAEGWEPEVLAGAQQSLKVTDYVAVDVGFERGPECEETLSSVCNVLFASGFEIMYFGGRPVRLLFKRAP